jgi:TPR repeat protein
VLQGQFYFLRQTEVDYRKAIEYYSQATQLDPYYALAWSGLSRAWTDLRRRGALRSRGHSRMSNRTERGYGR